MFQVLLIIQLGPPASRQYSLFQKEPSLPRSRLQRGKARPHAGTAGSLRSLFHARIAPSLRSGLKAAGRPGNPQRLGAPPGNGPTTFSATLQSRPRVYRPAPPAGVTLSGGGGGIKALRAWISASPCRSPPHSARASPLLRRADRCSGPDRNPGTGHAGMIRWASEAAGAAADGG